MSLPEFRKKKEIRYFLFITYVQFFFCTFLIYTVYYMQY